MIKSSDFTDDELQRFRYYQRLAFQILGETAAELKVGDTEEQVVRKLRKSFHQAGAHNYFHVPVALFGERSAYPGEFGPFEALATSRALQTDDTVILDAAPIFDGYTVDTSYAYEFGSSDSFVKIDRELPRLRDMIARRVNDGARWLDDDLPHHRRWSEFTPSA